MAVIINGTSGITNVNGSASTPAETGTDTDTGIYYGTNTVGLATNGTSALFIDASQNVGINTSSPSTYGKFAVAGQSSLGVDQADYVNVLGASGTARVETSGSSANSNLAFSTKGTGAIYFWRGGYGTTISAIIDGSGNVGIGTSSPGQKLEVNNGAADVTVLAKATGANYASFRVTNSSRDYSMQIRTDVSNAWVLRDETAGANRLVVDTSGNLLVGTTSQLGSSQVSVVSSQANQMVYLRNSNATPGGIFVNYSVATPNNTGSEFFFGNDPAQTRVTLRSNGGIANYSANNVNLSDRREKTNFAPAKSYLDVICAIPVQTFNYIDQNLEEDDGLTLGVVAQDVQAVAPELVSESDWSPEKDGSKMRLSIYQTDLQYALMKCIQEQQALITQLQADIATLKGQA